MTIILTLEHQQWLEAEVAAGRLASVEEGVREALDGCLLMDGDDLSWAKPLVDEALRALDSGSAIAGDEFRREIDDTISRLRRS